MSNLEKRLGNLLKKLRVDENSVLFAKGDKLNEKTVNKLAKSRYHKDTVLLNLYKEFKKNGGKIKELKTKVVINTPFVQERAVTQRGEMLHTIDGPMQLVHADVADLNFFSKSVVAPKYCLLCVDLFTSKVYTYGMNKKSQLADKLEKFNLEIADVRSYLKKEKRYKMRLQTDQEFNQNEIKALNKEHNVEHYNTTLNEGHAVAAEQKIRELKFRLKNFKRLSKISKNVLKPNVVLKKATNNMNIQPTRKYGVPPNEVEKKSIESEEYKLSYDNDRIRKVDKDVARYARYDLKRDKKSKKKLRSPLQTGEIVFVLSSRIKKKMHLLFFIREARTKKAFSRKIKNLLSQNDLKFTEEPSFTEFKNSTLDVKRRGGFSEKNCLL